VNKRFYKQHLSWFFFYLELSVLYRESTFWFVGGSSVRIFLKYGKIFYIKIRYWRKHKQNTWLLLQSFIASLFERKS